MKAIVYTGNGGWELKQVPEPEIRRPDDVKVRVDMACICGSDLSILNGRYLIDPGVILGHELTGLVLAAGPAVSRLRVGDRVVLAPNVPCHTCSTCMSGHENLCPNMKSYGENLDGGFAPFFVAPESQLYPVPEHVEPRVAAFAEPLACVLNAVGQLPVSPGQRALVLGAGPTGLLFIKCLIANGVDEIYVSAHGELRRQTAKDCGAIPIDDTSPAEDLFFRTNGHGADIVVDTVGTLLPEAVRCAAYGGHVILFGIHMQHSAAVQPADMVFKGLHIYGSYIDDYTFPQAIRLLAAGTIDPSGLISHVLPLEEFGTALTLLAERKAVKVLLDPQL